MNFIEKPIYKLDSLDWRSTLFLLVTPTLALALLPIYFYYFDLSWAIALSATFYLFFNNYCITAGYHRLFAHKSYQAKPWFQILVLGVGAGAFQNSALKWCTDHRRHHREVDGDEDPYSMSKGPFYAHFGWMLLKEKDVYRGHYAPDLLRQKWVMWQHRFYLPLAILTGFLVPTLWGWALGDIFGGFLFIGLVRIVLGHHTTFFVNSLCHMWGRRPYSVKHTARDNLFVALLTNGEGYHNFHHCFEGDYRNGVRWYQWDPTKWSIQILSWLGQTYKLRRTSKEAILRSRLEVDENLLLNKGIDIEQLKQLKIKIEALSRQVKQLRAEYRVMKKNLEDSSRQKLCRVRAEYKMAKIELKKTMAQWSAYVSIMQTAATV